MKNSLLIGLFFVVILFATACSNSSDTPASEIAATDHSSNMPQIALVMKTLTNPFFIEMERGAREAETEFGIHLIVRTAAQETSIEQQIAIVDELIRDKVDAIVIAPGDSLSLIPVLKQAQDEGIVVINIDNQLDPEFSEASGLIDVPFISVNNEEGAYLSAKYISEQIDSPTEAIILEGIPEAKNAQDRKAGAMRAFGENDNITIVASESAHWKIDEAYELSEELFAEHPDVKMVFAANDMMALGVIQYLQESNRDDVLVAAYDALDEAVAAIENGTLAVTIDQQAALQGYLGVEYAVKALNGDDLPSEMLVDVLVISSETME